MAVKISKLNKKIRGLALGLGFILALSLFFRPILANEGNQDGQDLNRDLQDVKDTQDTKDIKNIEDIKNLRDLEDVKQSQDSYLNASHKEKTEKEFVESKRQVIEEKTVNKLSVEKISQMVNKGVLEIATLNKRHNWPPPSPSMEKMKKKGCIPDGLLTSYGKENKNLRMINRSECVYLHRAIETWLDAPDFEEIKENIDKLEKKDLIIGMFLAEAIDTKEELYYPAEDRDFDFSEMCKKNTKNYWGEHSCIPTFEEKEYRKYLEFITQRAMDLGVQSFMFGQIFYQDDLEDPIAPEIIADMKAYAQSIGLEIVVGAQTNDITDEKYLKTFDYIEGGTGLYPSGNIEDNACFSRWWKKPGDWCWALLWHPNYAQKANNVLIHLDWSGKRGDDMSTFARMNDEKRIKTLKNLHTTFTNQGHGFLMPFMTALPQNNNGCYGEKERYYSANHKYSCDDEDAINEILKEVKIED
jgi:hypothetical protein